MSCNADGSMCCQRHLSSPDDMLLQDSQSRLCQQRLRDILTMQSSPLVESTTRECTYTVGVSHASIPLVPLQSRSRGLYIEDKIDLLMGYLFVNPVAALAGSLFGWKAKEKAKAVRACTLSSVANHHALVHSDLVRRPWWLCHPKAAVNEQLQFALCTATAYACDICSPTETAAGCCMLYDV